MGRSTKFSKTEKAIFSIALIVWLVYGIQFYRPSFNYWDYRMKGGNVLLSGDVIVRLAEKWYPIAVTRTERRDHVLFIKINPWFPKTENFSKISISATHAPFVMSEQFRSYLTETKFPWGDALLVNDRTYGGQIKAESSISHNTAFVFNGRVTIDFDHREDLQEIQELKTVTSSTPR